MITKVSVLYVGQIELENIGRDGTPADERRYPNERLIEAYFTARDIAQTMDDLGYYCLWLAEHHFQREGYEVIPNLILLSTWLATQTRRLKFGCAFNILPMLAPRPPGGRLRAGGHPHERPGDLRYRARLSYA